MSFDVPGIKVSTIDAESTIEQMLKRVVRREEKEIYAAWRAGYDYLHVVEDIDSENFMFNRAYIPHNYMKPPQNHGARTYDLRPEQLTSEMEQVLREYEP